MKKTLFAFLFVLTTLPMAFADPMKVLERGGDAIEMICNDASTYEELKCAFSDPQYHDRKSIMGTLYKNRDPLENFTESPVKLTYESNNKNHTFTTIVRPSFGFGIPNGDEGRGKITFKILNPAAAPDYEVEFTITTEEYDRSNGVIIMRRKSASSASSGAAARGSSSTAASSSTQTPTPSGGSDDKTNKSPQGADIIVTGNVKDNQGPVIGAVVLQKGTTNGTATDLDGNFAIKVPSNAKLEVNMLGYETQTLTATKEPVNIILKEDSQLLDEATLTKLHENGDVCNPAFSELNNDMFAISGEWHKKGNDWQCQVTGCNGGFKVDKKTNRCIVDCDKFKDEFNATAIKNKSVGPSDVLATPSEFCYPTACQAPNYALVGSGETAKCEPTGQPCNPDTAHATSGAIETKNGKQICKPICDDNYKAELKTDKYECVLKKDLVGSPCPKSILTNMDDNATKGIANDGGDDTGGVVTSCTITDCKSGFHPDLSGESCIADCKCGEKMDELTKECKVLTEDDKSCDAKNATSAEYGCDEKNRSYCKIKTCADGFTLNESKNKCESDNKKPCTAEQLAAIEHAKAGKQQVKGGTVACIVTECDRGYEPVPDGTSCAAEMVLTKEQYQQEIADLADNAKKMHEKETSLENRIIGAVGIGATGIGGMMVGSALSERAADVAAEREMAAYLQTFHCDYGDGKNVAGGTVNYELPGGNDMVNLYTEYAQLANDLKVRKEALGIRPGIESEVVIDKAETGLYDYENAGITGGTYASIARALLDPEGEDAQKWAAQRATTDSKLKTGAIVAGAGAVGSAAANLIVNSNNKSQLDTIKRKYEKLKVPFEDLERGLANNQTERKCSDFTGATGTYPKCTCPTKQYFSSEHGCIACTGDLIVNPTNDGCTCPTGQVQEGTTCRSKRAACTITKLKKSNICECVDNAEPIGGDCQCRKNFTENEDRSDCVRTPAEAVLPASATTAPASITIVDIQLGSDTAFASGKDTLTPTAVRRLWDFTQQAKQKIAATDSKIDLSKENDYCIFIIGKTDHQPFKNPDNNTRNNQSLSERRAKSVGDYLSNTFNATNIQSYGIAAADCTPTTPVSNEKCRVVNVKMLTGSCGDNLSNSGKWIESMVQNTAARGTAVQGLIDGFKAATSGNK